MKNKYLTTIEYFRKVKTLNHLKRIGAEIIPKKKNKIIRFIGFVCLGIAIFPNGAGVVFYPLSFMLLGLSFQDLEKYKRILKHELKYQVKKRQ